MKASKITRAAGIAAITVACVFGLAACASSSSTSGKVAATVNGTEISEDTVTNYIQNFRTSSSLTDADSWGGWMAEYSLTPSSVRDEVIDYYEKASSSSKKPPKKTA